MTKTSHIRYLPVPRVPDRAHPRHFMPRNPGPFSHGHAVLLFRLPSVTIASHSGGTEM
jgi:hypothetical protein